MAVQPQTPYKEYTTNGSANSFALEFDCDNQDHLIVLVDDVEPVVGTWSLIGGAVVFGTAPINGKKITIQRNTPFRRDGDFQSYDNSFRPGSVNKGLDKVWLKLQELGVADWILSNRINDLRAYVDKQDNVLQDNIDSLKNYVDDKDDELRNYLLNAIQEQGVALDQLEEYYSYLMQQLAQVAIDRGWAASFIVSADGSTQQEINDFGGAKWWNKPLGYDVGSTVKLENGDIVKSTVPNNTVDPNVNMTGWVKTNSTSQVFDESGESQQQVNDKIANKTYFIITPEMFGAKGYPHDDTAALQAALDFISPTQWDTSVAVMNLKGGGGKLVLPRRYRITDTLWVGAYTTIEGMGDLGFNSSLLESVSAIVTDFADPLKPAMSSSNWKTGGVRVAYDEQTTGAQYDGGLVSATHGIKLNGFSLLTATGKRGYIGLRLQNSPQSEIKLFINGFDYGVLANASWQSSINCRTLHYKCGLLAHLDNNGLNFDGYYNAITGTPLVAKNLVDFFTIDTDTSTELNNASTQFGAVFRFNLAISSRQVICEHNDVGLTVCSGDASIQTLYSEYNRIASFASYTTSTTIDNLTGAGDAGSFLLGVNSKLSIENDSQSGIAVTNRVNKISQYNSYLSVPFTFPAYDKGIIYKNKKNVIYIDSTSGNDLYSGLTTQYPLKTINAVFNRISEGYAFADSTNVLKTLQNWEVVILDAGSYTITANTELTGNIHIYASSPANVPTITTNNYTRMSHCHLVFEGITVVRPNISFGDIAFENGAFWFKYGTNILEFIACSVSIVNYGLTYPEYIGASDSTLVLNRCTTTGLSASQLVQSNYLDERPHIISVLRTGGTISAEITGRVDKGVSVPIAWQNKILGI